ncbi:MAG: sugar phosphate isomerase/epimerase [Phycisphaerales bacterium]|nr:sugar phosphate isomerase/epimerase [Phycisphaerales bacterium]
MIKPAFSTVACLDWTLDKVAAAAAQWGFEAVELRTFGPDSRVGACDPALTDEDKVRSLFGARGVEILSLATSMRFDAPIRPPIIGLAISDTERSVREGKRAVDMAVGLECPLIRVFGFESPAREKRGPTIARIAKRLSMVVDHAHRTGVRLVLENAGDFATAPEMLRVIDAVGSPLLGAAYSIAPAFAHGEQPRDGIELLGDRLWLARIKDTRAGLPVALGEGELPCHEMVCALVDAKFSGPLVFEWDRAWIPGLESPETMLPRAARTLYNWVAEQSGACRAPAAPQIPQRLAR